MQTPWDRPKSPQTTCSMMFSALKNQFCGSSGATYSATSRRVAGAIPTEDPLKETGNQRNVIVTSPNIRKSHITHGFIWIQTYEPELLTPTNHYQISAPSPPWVKSGAVAPTPWQMRRHDVTFSNSNGRFFGQRSNIKKCPRPRRTQLYVIYIYISFSALLKCRLESTSPAALLHLLTSVRFFLLRKWDHSIPNSQFDREDQPCLEESCLPTPCYGRVSVSLMLFSVEFSSQAPLRRSFLGMTAGYPKHIET